MIKTYIEGDKRKLNPIKFFKCNSCGWCGTADKEDYQFEECYAYSYYFLRCPCCNNEAREMGGKEVQELLKQVGNTPVGFYSL